MWNAVLTNCMVVRAIKTFCNISHVTTVCVCVETVKMIHTSQHISWEHRYVHIQWYDV